MVLIDLLLVASLIFWTLADSISLFNLADVFINIGIVCLWCNFYHSPASQILGEVWKLQVVIETLNQFIFS